MNRKTLLVLSVTGAISIATALSTMSIAMARSDKTSDILIRQAIASSPNDQQTPGGERKRPSIVSGTVKSLTSTAIVVTDTDAKDVSIPVNGETQFTVKGAADKTIAQLLAGQKVTVLQDADGVAKVVISGAMPKPQMRPVPGGRGPGGPGGGPRMGPGGGPGMPKGSGGPGRGPGAPGAPAKPANVGFGTVAEISATSITVTLVRPAGDKTVESYAINSDTKIMANGGTSPLAVGDTVLVVADEGEVAKSITRAPGLRKPGPAAQPKTTST